MYCSVRFMYLRLRYMVKHLRGGFSFNRESLALPHMVLVRCDNDFTTLLIIIIILSRYDSYHAHYTAPE